MFKVAAQYLFNILILFNTDIHLKIITNTFHYLCTLDQNLSKAVP